MAMDQIPGTLTRVDLFYQEAERQVKIDIDVDNCYMIYLQIQDILYYNIYIDIYLRIKREVQTEVGITPLGSSCDKELIAEKEELLCMAALAEGPDG